MISNKITKFAILIFAFSAVSCTSFDVDILRDTIKESTDDYEINVNEMFLDSKDKDIYNIIDPVNIKMANVIDSLVTDTKSSAVVFFSKYTNTLRRSKAKRPKYKYELVTTDTIFICSKKLISTQIKAYTYNGGANGKTSFFSFNYSPDTFKFYKKEDVLNVDKKDKINALLEKYMNNPDKCFTIKPTLDAVTTFNITAKSVIFTFEELTLGAHSCGACVITVPISELGDAYKL